MEAWLDRFQSSVPWKLQHRPDQSPDQQKNKYFFKNSYIYERLFLLKFLYIQIKSFNNTSHMHFLHVFNGCHRDVQGEPNPPDPGNTMSCVLLFCGGAGGSRQILTKTGL